LRIVKKSGDAMTTQPPTQPPGAPTPDVPARTHACQIGRSYEYLCQLGDGTDATFTYSHKRFGKVVWHRGHA
jgi:hypothetical protein